MSEKNTIETLIQCTIRNFLLMSFSCILCIFIILVGTVIVNFRCSTYFNIAFWTYLNYGGNEPINTVIRPVFGVSSALLQLDGKVYFLGYDFGNLNRVNILNLSLLYSED